MITPATHIHQQNIKDRYKKPLRTTFPLKSLPVLYFPNYDTFSCSVCVSECAGTCFVFKTIIQTQYLWGKTIKLNFY